MSIKPILFNTDMVRAILDGRKTVTRRLIKPQPTYSPCDGFTWKGAAYGTDIPQTIKGAAYNIRCAAPYQLGDILYVRETWSEHYTADSNGKLVYCYKADGTNLKSECLPGENNRWYPSIHMPKEAARIWIKVKNLRVERLQEITTAQAEQEGVGDLFYEEIGYDDKNYGNPVDEKYGIAKEQFAWLWNSTIKKSDLDCYGWNANPWVWVIEFEQCEKPEGW